MKVKVNELCTGHARCYALYDGVYDTDELGFNLYKGSEFEVPEGREEEARKGAAACPERAIEIEEE